MATAHKRPESNDVELTYGSHLKDIHNEANSVRDGDNRTHEQDEREIRRMGKTSQFKVRRYCLTVT